MAQQRRLPSKQSSELKRTATRSFSKFLEPIKSEEHQRAYSSSIRCLPKSRLPAVILHCSSLLHSSTHSLNLVLVFLNTHHRFSQLLYTGIASENICPHGSIPSADAMATAEIKIGQVDDVQELQRACLTTVPDRYIRDGDDRPDGAKLCDYSQIPVVDVGELPHDGELNKLRLACEEWGFFQVVNHGIADELLDEMEKVTREFFMLPLEEKEKYPMAPGGIQGYGHAFVFSEDQKLDWSNMLALGVDPAFIRQPNLWPTNPPSFKETLEKYSAEIRGLCRRLLAHIAETLGLAPGAFNDMFGEAVQAVRMNFYPPCPRPELVLGLSAHSDGSAVTVLQQDMSCAGLQVIKDGAWVPVHPIPHALVINLGDTLEVLTNGRYKSVEHRAVTNDKQDRLSIVTFYAPAYDVELGPLPEFVSDDAPCKYRRFNHGEYSRHYVTSKLEGKKTLEFAKINSSTTVGEKN